MTALKKHKRKDMKMKISGENYIAFCRIILFPYAFYRRSVPAADGGYRANFLAGHADDIAGLFYRNGIKRGHKAGILGTYGNAGSAFDTGVPVNVKYDRGSSGHIRFYPK
jgi:hypothetical protein